MAVGIAFNGKELMCDSIPGRKRKALTLTAGVECKVLAFFRDDESADEFGKFIENLPIPNFTRLVAGYEEE